MTAEALFCEHKAFASHAAVTRLTGVEGGPVTGYSCDLRVHCVECGTAFAFIGVPGGLSPSAPRVSLDALELRLPIAPAADVVAPIEGPRESRRRK